MAAEDQAVNTNYFKNKILKEELYGKSRLCKKHEKTIGHLTSVSSILTKNEYLMKRDKFCDHLHCSIFKAFDIETTDKCTHTHTHTQKPV